MKTITKSSVSGGGFARLFTGARNMGIMLDKPNEGGEADDDKSAADDTAAVAAAAAAEKAEKEAKDKKGDAVSDDQAKLLKDMMKHKNQAKELQAQLDKMLPVIGAIEGLGGLEKLQELAKAQADADKEKLEKAGEFEALKKMIVEENQAKVAEAEKKIAEKDAVLSSAMRTIDELTIGAAFAASEVVGDTVLTPSKARAIYGAHFESENGVVVAYDKPKGAASRTKIVDGSGEPVSFEVALKKLIDADPDKERLIKSKLVTGAGSRTTDEKSAKTTTELRGVSRIEASLLARQKK
jgi:hypothetical protein